MTLILSDLQGSEYGSRCSNLFLLPIFNISKPRTMIQKKVRCDWLVIFHVWR